MQRKAGICKWLVPVTDSSCSISAVREKFKRAFVGQRKSIMGYKKVGEWVACPLKKMVRKKHPALGVE